MNNVISLPNRALEITLTLSDPEVLHELEKRDDGAAREAFATQALRLGVLALRQASGSLDAEVIRREGEQLLSSVGAVLRARTTETRDRSRRRRIAPLPSPRWRTRPWSTSRTRALRNSHGARRAEYN